MDKEVIKALASFNQITFIVIGTFIVSYFIGKGIDYLFGTEFFLPVFLILGVFASFRGIHAYAQKITKNKKDK